ncbi:MAG: IPT/TIG domain-containing protein, partial [Chitinophagaceae bacterium]|nr:IPT/TIG domain-containing protein [Chitinophagaceae bacterium]
ERRKVTFVAGETYYNPLNGHFYRPITSNGSWVDNKLATQSLSYYGRQGYLVTLTSESENSFVSKFVGQNSWIGCSDNYLEINNAVGYTKYADQNAAEGYWHWVTGPEKGTEMRTGNAQDYRVGPAKNGVYQNWASGEPNDWSVNGIAGNEDYGHMYANNGTWNDFPNTSSIRSIYEFGDMPNDNTVATPFFTRDIAVQGASSGSIAGGGVAVCSGTNSTVLTLTNFTGVVANWEMSFDNFITPGTTINNSSLSYTATNLSKTTYFRAVVNPTTPSGCTGLLTPSTVVNVTPANGGNILATGGNTICQGGEVVLVLSGNSGSVSKWQKSSDNTNWIDIINNTVNYSEVLNSIGTFYYRAVVTNDCGTLTNSSSITVTVQAGTPPVGGVVSSMSHSSISNSGSLNLTDYTGTIQKWQKSEDDGLVWLDIANTSSSYFYSNISKKTLFRVSLQNGNCGSAFSAAGAVTILTPSITVTGTLNTFNSCIGTVSSTQTFSISGANLTSDINIAAVTGFEYSIDGINYSSTLTLPRTGSSITNTSIYVRLSANAVASSSGIIFISATGATTRAVSVEGTVNDPAPPIATNASRYGSGAVVISASVANGNTVDWYESATGGNALTSGATSFTTPSIIQTTTYFAQARNIAAGCLSLSRTAVTASILNCSDATPNVQFRLSAPNVTTASIQGNVGTRTESFDGFNYGSIASSGTFAVGSFTKSNTGAAEIKADDVWGGSGSRYLQIASSGSVSINLTDPSRYVGFWWGAGNANNNVTIYGSCGGNEITLGTFTTQTVLDLLAGSTIKAVDGNTYNSSLYRRSNASNEPFAYVNLQLDDPNIYFTRIVFSGSGFEFDNVTTAVDWGTVSGLSVSNFSPIPAKSGETITINGNGFTGTSAVKIGGVNARSYRVISPTQITAIVPTDATVNTRVTVTNDGIEASLGGFVFDCSSNALDFDGTNDHVVLGDVIESLSSFSQEAWVFWRGSSAAHSEIFSKEAVSAMSITSDNKLHANFGNGSAWGAGVNSATSIPLNKWTHVAITRNSSGLVKLYINGILDANSATLNLTGGNTLGRAIGAKYLSNGTLAGAFNGLIDELRVWNTERTAAQINAGLGTELIGNESGLITYYNFNQGTASGTNSTITTLNNLISTATPIGTLTNFTRSGTTSNLITGVWPVILTQPASTLS